MRIVSLLSSATEILYAVGAGDCLVGVSHECDWPIGVRLLPRVTCTSLAGACASSDIDREITSKLAGRAVGNREAAQRCVDELRLRVDRVAQRTAPFTAEDRPRTIVIEWLDPLMVSGNWMPELVDLAGGINGLSVARQPSRRHSWHDIPKFDPEVIVVAACGFDIERTWSEMPTLASLPGWCDIAAVQDRRVFVADGNAYFNRSGPRLVDSLELLAGLLHPNLFAPSDDTAFRSWRA